MTETLHPPASTARAPLEYLAAVWKMRHYALRLGTSAVRAANGGTSLGSLWLILEPVISIAIYWAIFGVLLDISRGVDNFLAFLTVGQLTFALCQRTLLGASGSLSAQAPMLRSLAFPRTVLPISEAVRALSTFRFESAVMVMAVVAMGVSPRISWLLIPAIALTGAATALGIGFGMARVVSRIADVQRLLTHLMRLAFYASGVFFPLAEFTDSSALLRLAALNPFYDYVELMRWAVLGTAPAESSWVLTAALLWPVIALALGGWYFVRAEHTYSGARTVRAK